MDESYLSSSPSIPEEEIDFQYVYALRTFTATEQGQATALKGDAMILLNDSNSYWWLVRLVKDGTVGFLPAEHVETPSERLARLNKHRNGDVSSASFSVLKKHQDKQTKNKPKKKRKTVSFKQVYISSDEDDDDDVGLVDDIVEFSDFSEAEESLLEDPENNNIIINGSSISIDSTTSSIMSAKSVEVKQVVVINNASTSTNHESSINDNNNNSNNHLENSTIDPTSRNNNNDDTDSSDDDSDEELMIPSKIKKNSLLNAKSSTENLLRRKTSAASISSSSSVSNHSLASGSTTDSSPTSSPEMFSASSHKLHPQIIPIYKETSIKLDQISSVSGLFLQLSSMARILIFFNFFLETGCAVEDLSMRLSILDVLQSAFEVDASGVSRKYPTDLTTCGGLFRIIWMPFILWNNFYYYYFLESVTTFATTNLPTRLLLSLFQFFFFLFAPALTTQRWDGMFHTLEQIIKHIFLL